MGFRTALHFPHFVLQLAASAVERVVDRERHIGKPFIRRRAAIDIDLASFGQGKANAHLVKAAAAVTFAEAGYAHAAGSDAVVSTWRPAP